MIISFILEMGACMSAQKVQNKKPPRNASEVQSDMNPVQEYLVFEEANKNHKKCREQHDQSTPKANTQHNHKVLLSSFKRNPTTPISDNQEAGEYELPKEIVEFIQSSQKRSIMREKEIDYQNKKVLTSKKTIYISSEILDFTEKNFSAESSLVTELLEERSEYEIVPTDANRIYESKFQRQLLSTSEFKAKLQKIKLIEEQPAKLFKFESELGKGSMCRVYRASSHKDPSKCYAVRIISIEHQKILQKLKEEITVMTLCQSYNIIKYHFSYYFQKTLFMFIEYMDYGALNHFIAHYSKKIEERVIAYIIREILKGLNSIHKRRQVHRDLKSDNILINRKGDIKIGDFGYAIQLTKDSQSSRQIAGTPAWMAPQLIKKQEYTESVDIWSLGIILVELCQGEPKYLKLDPYMAMIMIVTKSPETVTGRSASLQNFLSRCLQKDPQQRATTRQLLNDAFIGSIGEGKFERQTFLSMLRRVPYNFY